MDSFDRLERMLEGTDFMSFPDLTSEDPMKDLEDHNQRQWEKLGNQQSQRIQSLWWAVAADELQQLALAKFGNTSDSAVRGVLEEILNDKLQELEAKQEWQECVKAIQDHFVDQEAYCMKCRAKREMKSPKKVTMKNGKPATSGVCPKCGTKMFRIGKA